MRSVAGLALVLAAIGAGSASASTSRTALTVTYWEKGAGTTPKIVKTLSCNPAGGTLERPAVACRRLATGGRKLFAPVAGGTVCTQIYGGPQVALVTGTFRGRRVWARFQRRNGCEIARWNDLSPWLLPPGGVT